MTLRRQLALTFGALVLAVVGASTIAASLVVTDSYRRRADEALLQDLAVWEDDLRARLERADSSLHSLLARSGPSAALADHVRERLAALTGGGIDAAELVDLASTIGAALDLPYVQVVRDGILISSRHWPQSLGRPAPELAPRTAAPDTGATHARWVWVREAADPNRRVPALVTAASIDIGHQRYDVWAGTVLDARALAQAASALGSPVALWTEAGWRTASPRSATRPLTASELPRRPLERGLLTVGSGAAAQRLATSPAPLNDPQRELGQVVLLVARPEAPLAEALADLRRTLAWLALSGTVLAMLVAALVARRLASPVEAAARAASRVAAGALDTRLAERGSSETRALADSFNRMTIDLADERQRLIHAERTAAWRDVARRMAHEIGNVLSPIQLAVDSIRRAHTTGSERLPEVVESSSRIVGQEVDRLRRLVREFSDFARAPAPRPQPTDVARLVADVVDMARSTHPRLSVDIADQTGEAELDGDAVAAALYNLILNAVQAATDGTVQVSASGDQNVVRIAVDDDGPGIPESERDRIFKPYATGRGGGTGLGLAIVVRTVTDHGGRVELDSTVGRGSSFRLVLPRRFAGGGHDAKASSAEMHDTDGAATTTEGKPSDDRDHDGARAANDHGEEASDEHDDPRR